MKKENKILEGTKELIEHFIRFPISTLALAIIAIAMVLLGYQILNPDITKIIILACLIAFIADHLFIEPIRRYLQRQKT